MKYFVFIIALILSIELLGDYSIKKIADNRYQVRVSSSEYNLTHNDQFTSVSIDDFQHSNMAGIPNLPFLQIQVAVPPNGYVETKVIQEKKSTEILHSPIEPIPTILPDGKTFQYHYIIDEQAYQNRETKQIEIQPTSKLRNLNYQTIQINPFLYKKSTNRLDIVSELIFEVIVRGETDYYNPVNDPFERSLNEFFINYSKGKNWFENSTQHPAKIPFEKSDFWYKIHLSSAQNYRIDQSQLAILPSFVRAEQIRMLALLKKDDLYHLQEIPLTIKAGNIFFSLPENYRNPHQVWLTFGGNFPHKPRRLILESELQNSQPIQSLKKYSKQSTNRQGTTTIFIAPNEFLDATQVLADFHQNYHNLVCSVVDQQTIVDTYSDGSAAPDAIQMYLNDHFSNDLQHVVLVGSGTVQGIDSESLTSWYNLSSKNKILVHYPADDYFVTPVQASYPSCVIGRIPAKTRNELEMYVSRVQEYTENPTLDWWRNQLLFLADDENKSGGYEGLSSLTGLPNGLNHSYLTETTARVIDKNIWIEKIFAFNYPFDEFNQKPEATNQLIDHINDGVLCWVYIGHGNHDTLGDEDYFIGTLHSNYFTNTDRLNLMIAASCSVGEFFEDSYDCIGEQQLFLNNGGSIATIAASQSCNGTENVKLTRRILENIYNRYDDSGYALFDAKLNSTSSISNSRLYHHFGDPILSIIPPRRTGTIDLSDNLDDSLLNARETVHAQGNLELDGESNQIGDVHVFDTALLKTYQNLNYVANDSIYTIHYWENGNEIFRGQMNIMMDQFKFSFIVPDDIHSGEEGRIITYTEQNDTAFSSLLYPIKYSNEAIDIQSNQPPEVSIWIDSDNFQTGDYVSTSPTIYAHIFDENGINISGEAGRKILLLFDKSQNEEDLIDVTQGFSYELGSHTSGMLAYPLSDIEEGFHTIDLYVYDNFGEVAIASTEFYAQKSGKISLQNMLPYPNPMKREGKFTFVITEPADVTLKLFTITGKNIRTIVKKGCSANYNELNWNGKDQDGDYLANNTYLYQIKATSLENGKTTTKMGKFIVYK